GARSIGRGALFTRDAARMVVAQSAGSPRLLRRNASLAYFAAASDGQTRISAEHVSQALEANSFATAVKNPNEGKSWTKSDPSDHSVLYQKSVAQPPPPGENPRQAADTISSRRVETPPTPPPKGTSSEKPAE